MKQPAISGRCATVVGHPSPGFTLLELLAAMVVLSLLLILMSDAVNGVMQSTRRQNQQMDGVVAARQALDVMTMDLQTAAIDDSRTILVPDGGGGGELFTMYARRRSPEGAAGHRFLALAYSLTPDGQLTRSYASESFTQNEPAEPDTPVVLAGGVLGFQMRVFTENGANFPVTEPVAPNWATMTYAGQAVTAGHKALVFPSATWAAELPDRSIGFELWIAAADPQTISLLRKVEKWETVVTKLQETADPHQWRTEIDALDIPSSAKSALRILNKTIPMHP